MEPGHLIHINCKKIVLLRLAWRLALSEGGVDLLGEEARSSCQGFLDVIWVQELFDCLSGTLTGEELSCLTHIGEEVVRGFALLDFFGLLEEHTG